MVLASAGASHRFLVLELPFDEFLARYAFRAEEAAASSLVLVQLRAWEHQVSFVAAFPAGIRAHVARREASGRASGADCFAFVLFGVVQHVLVERGFFQYLLASLAAVGSSLPLALDALTCISSEGARMLRELALAAGVASCTSHGPVPRYFLGVLPLRCGECIWPQSFPADGTLFAAVALCALSRSLEKSLGRLLYTAGCAAVAPLAAQEPIVIIFSP